MNGRIQYYLWIHFYFISSIIRYCIPICGGKCDSCWSPVHVALKIFTVKRLHIRKHVTPWDGTGQFNRSGDNVVMTSITSRDIPGSDRPVRTLETDSHWHSLTATWSSSLEFGAHSVVGYHYGCHTVGVRERSIFSSQEVAPGWELGLVFCQRFCA